MAPAAEQNTTNGVNKLPDISSVPPIKYVYTKIYPIEVDSTNIDA